MIRWIILTSAFLLLTIKSVNGQPYREGLKDRMTLAETTIPGLTETVDISVNGMEIRELLYSLGTSVKLNITADENLNQKVTGNFSRIRLSDLLLHLSEKYSLDFRITGEIIYFFNYVPVPKKKERVMLYNDSSRLLTLDLKNDSLGPVLRQLSSQTGVNCQYDNSLYVTPVTCYIKNGTMELCIGSIASAADLRVTEIDSLTFRFQKREQPVPAAVTQNTRPSQFSGDGPVISRSKDGISVTADRAEIREIIGKAADLLNAQYLLVSEIKGQVTVSGEFESFESLLQHLLLNTAFGYHKHDLLYLIGARLDESIRTTKIYSFRQRSLEGIADQIPAEIKKGLEIRSFPELNGLVISGSAPATAELISFLESIDRKVPVIDIEVYIADIRDSRLVSTGIRAGLDGTVTETSGNVYPSGDVHLNAVTVNEIMAGITKLGLFNLGRVGPAFFLKLKLLEEQGALKIRSTPRLATLNGHEARMSIGRTEYYLEIQNNVIGTQNPQNLISQQYKSVNADLSLTINPVVSENEDITLGVQVTQSNFTERISPNAPPGSISRDFHSLLRVRNGEMVVLGGLEEDSRNQTSNGIPLLSRIPVLKWIFSSRTKSRSKSRLTIFIKPTVVYN